MNDNAAISRRDLIAAGATGAAGAAGLAIVGAANASEANEDTTQTAAWLPEAWDYECDVLVIGYGGAGQWAALTAADPEEGASEVLVLEKSPVRGGGNSSMNLGEFALPVSADGAFEYVKAFCMGQTDDESIRAWADECVRNGEYADHWNLPWIQLQGSLASGGTSSCEYPFLPGSEAMGVAMVEGKGMQAFQVLDDARKNLGIEVVFDCHDEELIQNPETKEILGCYTLVGSDETRKAVKARKGVVLTMGGFEFNEELKDKYLPVERARGFYGWKFNTGDGIGMVQKVGAQLWHMGNMIGGKTAQFDDPEHPSALWMTPTTNAYIWVTQQGKRFVDENCDAANAPHNGWHEFLHFNADICDYDCAPLWVIVDQTCVDGGRIGDYRNEDNWGLMWPEMPEELGGWEGWSEDNQAEIEKGWLRKADTIEELAALIAETSPNMDAAILAQTVADYNAACEAGEDVKFGRDPETLVPLSTPPFYAWPEYVGGCSTLGGPQKNGKGQVLDVSGNVIPRLYAGGSFGNTAGHTYGITGGNNAENMVWGRIGGRNAAAETPWA